MGRHRLLEASVLRPPFLHAAVQEASSRCPRLLFLFLSPLGDYSALLRGVPHACSKSDSCSPGVLGVFVFRKPGLISTQSNGPPPVPTHLVGSCISILSVRIGRFTRQGIRSCAQTIGLFTASCEV